MRVPCICPNHGDIASSHLTNSHAFICRHKLNHAFPPEGTNWPAVNSSVCVVLFINEVDPRKIMTVEEFVEMFEKQGFVLVYKPSPMQLKQFFCLPFHIFSRNNVSGIC